MKSKSKTKEPPKEVELIPKSKQLLESVESTASAIYEDMDAIGDQVDEATMNLEQLRDEVKKLRKENEQFRWEVRKLIADEITKQVKPLVEQLDELTTQKPKIVYIRFKIPLLDFFKNVYGTIKSWFRNALNSLKGIFRK